MSIEETIKSLKNDWFVSLFGQLCVDMDKKDKFLEAVGMAISALRAQQEAEKGCKYCRDGEVIAWDMCNDAVTIQTDGRIHIIGGGDWECEINYCPMCGRQLRRPPKEAHNV